MALTATATNLVQADIIQNLGIQDCVKYKQSFNRPNLRYKVLRKSKSVQLDIVSFIKTHYDGQCGIIYCLSKKDCEVMAETLSSKYHLRASYFHAGLAPKDRQWIQEKWANNEIRIIVATIAFGMGIDKADVRFVIHYSLPKSLEGYYQVFLFVIIIKETGRAGRDGLNSTCVLYYSYGDRTKIEFMIDKSEGDRDQKQRQRDNLREVIRFCENRVDCRRKLVLRYFSENFNSSTCNATCDNCEKSIKYTQIDRTTESVDSISLFKSISSRITLNQLIDIYRGSLAKPYQKYQTLDKFGCGKQLSRLETERLFQHLTMEDVFQEQCISNSMGFIQTYLKVLYMHHE